MTRPRRPPPRHLPKLNIAGQTLLIFTILPSDEVRLWRLLWAVSLLVGDRERLESFTKLADDFVVLAASLPGASKRLTNLPEVKQGEIVTDLLSSGGSLKFPYNLRKPCMRLKMPSLGLLVECAHDLRLRGSNILSIAVMRRRNKSCQQLEKACTLHAIDEAY